MSTPLTEAEFSKHVNTKFRVTNPAVELELTQVKGYLSQPNEQSGMERFSAFFRGPGDPYLPQATYTIDHEMMGNFDLFLVPVVKDGGVFYYEAVFNYFKQ